MGIPLETWEVAQIFMDRTSVSLHPFLYNALLDCDILKLIASFSAILI